MTIRPIKSIAFVVAALAMMLASPAVSAQTPPAGDSHLAPVTVRLNASETVTGVQFATLEAPLIEAASCDFSDSSDHSVWFQFTLPYAANIDIDSAGTLLDTGAGMSSLAVMTIYHQSGLSLIETACSFDQKPRMVDVYLDQGLYFIRLASYYGGLQGPSQYRIGIRVRDMEQILADPFFDEPLGTAWKIKKAGDPPQIVRTCAPYCVISFNGIAGGKLQHTLPIDPSVMKIKVGDYFMARTRINGTPPTGSGVRITIKLKYSDGTPTTKVSQVEHVTEATTASATTTAPLAIEIKSKALKSVKFIITSPAAVDTFLVLDGEMSLSAGSIGRDVLPLPAQP